MKKILLLLLMSSMLFACSKKECKKNNTGELKLENTGSYRVKVTIEDMEPFWMEPGDEFSGVFEAGAFHDVNAVFYREPVISTTYSVGVNLCKEKVVALNLD